MVRSNTYNFLKIIGKTLKGLKVLRFDGHVIGNKTGQKHKYFIAVCKHGIERRIHYSNLISKKSKPRGCKSTCAREHWCTEHKFYVSSKDRKTLAGSSYYSMGARCLNKKHQSYDDYGGRGITICNRWLAKDGFKYFLEDMGERPIGKTLDRINPNGNYEPLNCRWATNKQQANNKRKNYRKYI